MKVIKKMQEDGSVLLEATASTSEVSQALNRAQRAFCTQMNIRPMPDKTPAELAQEQLGIRDLDAVVAPQALELLVPFAIEKHGIVPAYAPVPEPQGTMKRGRTIRFNVTYHPKLSYELPSYDPVSITVEPFAGAEAAIDQQISQMAEQYATYVTDDARVIEKNNSCLLAIDCSKDGERVKNLCTDGRTYTVGIGLMPDGFDNAVCGMKVGQTKTFTFEGPDIDEEGNEISETYECTVTVKEAQKKTIPVIDDAWVEKNMPMMTDLAGLRKAIGSSIEPQMRRQYDDYVRTVATNELAKRFDGKIPDEVYTNTMRTIVTDMRRKISQQGNSWDNFVEENGGEQQMNMMLMMQTRQVLVQQIVLDALFNHEDLVITDDDLREVCEGINPGQPDLVRKQMEELGQTLYLRESAERLRASKWLVEHASITVRKPEDTAPSENVSDAEQKEDAGSSES